MREILKLCIELDHMAYDAYRALAKASKDEELAESFEALAKEEHVHVEWWTELLVAWETGLLPDIADEHHLLERLREMRSELQDVVPRDLEDLSVDDALDIAVRFEFHMLDPLFGELVDLMRPGSKTPVRESYARHVLRLVDLIERRYSRHGMSVFFAGILRRAYRDQQRLAALVVRDPLTSLLNRRGLLSHMAQWLSWSVRYGRPLGVVLLDIDHFKAINDSYGHAAGDSALGAVADAITETVRESDIVGRFGGDEFVVLAPEADGEELDILMQRLVSTLAETAIPVGGETLSISVSVGGAWAPGGTAVTPEVLLAQADRAMYRAKEAGRNRAAGAVSIATAMV